MLMAEYPELKNKTMNPKQPYDFFYPAFASTSATNPQQMLLKRNDFSMMKPQNNFATQQFGKQPTREPRFSRNAADYNFEDINDRDLMS
jgi:hypothetical protein